jgi:thiol-disulfide isomerase/thioredoxin
VSLWTQAEEFKIELFSLGLNQPPKVLAHKVFYIRLSMESPTVTTSSPPVITTHTLTRLTKMKRTLYRLPGLFLLSLWLIATPHADAFQVGESAPGFTLKNLNGESVTLDHNGDRPVLLELGTTWCPGCRVQSEEINAVAEYFGKEKLAVMEVFIQETEASVRPYIEDVGGHPENTLLDDDTVRREYAVFLIPRVLIISAKGEVLYDGGLTKSDLLIEKIDSHLENSNPLKQDTSVITPERI